MNNLRIVKPEIHQQDRIGNELLDDINSTDHKLKFCDTEAHRLIKKGINNSRKYDIMVGVVGDPGRGKTFSIETITADEEKIFVLSLGREKQSQGQTVKALQRAINEKLNCHFYKQTLGIAGRAQEIIEELYRNNQLAQYTIIVDQSEYLSVDSLDVLRSLHENNFVNIGIVFIGTTQFRELLLKEKTGYLHLRRRIKQWLIIPEPSLEEFSRVIDLNWKGLNEKLKKTFYQVSEKNYGLLENMIFNLKLYMAQEENRDRKLDEDDIHFIKPYAILGSN